MTNGQWNVRLLETYKVTIELLEEIQDNTPYGYKPLESIELYCYRENPTWDDIQMAVEIGYNNTPEALAYELAHGHHREIMDETGLGDSFGEDFCEAIRFYVEERMPTDSDWLNEMRGKIENSDTTGHLAVLEACEDLATYIMKLNGGELFEEIGWG